MHGVLILVDMHEEYKLYLNQLYIVQCLFRFLRQEWKSGSISVPPDHRVTLCQFIEKLKRLVVVKSTNKRRKDSQVQLNHSKRVK